MMKLFLANLMPARIFGPSLTMILLSFMMTQINCLLYAIKRTCTIFALSSGSLPSAIAIIRLSGDKSYFCIQQLTRKNNIVPRKLFYSKLFKKDGEVIDRAMNVYLPGPATFTGENMVEFYVHGGRAVVDCLCDALNDFNGVRPAKAGEFTKRAFYNSKLNFNQVESLSWLLGAETQSQRKLAVEERGLTTALAPIRIKLIAIRSSLEAAIDFADDVGINRFDFIAEVNSIIADLEQAQIRTERGSLISNGIRIVLIGRTNAGKSSIVNCLAQRDIAIVSDVEGTTRDVLEGRIELCSMPVILIDTAGIRKSHDSIEVEGVSRALDRVKEAHIVLIVIDASRCNDPSVEVQNLLLECNPKDEVRVIVVYNKADLLCNKQLRAAQWRTVYTSCLRDDGCQTLLNAVMEEIKLLCPTEGNDGLLSRYRQRILLSNAIDSLKQISGCEDLAIIGEILRDVSDQIGEICGIIVNEDILDKLFSSFCIGK